MPERSVVARVGWTLRDYARRVWDNSGEDNIFFLAGAISFNVLLAVVPFFLLLTTGMAYLLRKSPDASSLEVSELVARFLPSDPSGTASAATKVLTDIIRTRGAVGVYSAIGFVWFSTRLFGTLRSVLAAIFDIEIDRGIIDGKIFDVKITIVSSFLLLVYTVLSAYLAIASTRGASVLVALGLRQDVMGQLEYTLGRLVAFLFIMAMFYGLYKFLPFRRIRWQTALLAATFTSVAFELAKTAFAQYVQSFRPGSLYTGTLAALVITVIWIYYAAVVFILGGEVAQVYELRRVRKLQREAFED